MCTGMCLLTVLCTCTQALVLNTWTNTPTVHVCDCSLRATQQQEIGQLSHQSKNGVKLAFQPPLIYQSFVKNLPSTPQRSFILKHTSISFISQSDEHTNIQQDTGWKAFLCVYCTLKCQPVHVEFASKLSASVSMCDWCDRFDHIHILALGSCRWMGFVCIGSEWGRATINAKTIMGHTLSRAVPF